MADGKEWKMKKNRVSYVRLQFVLCINEGKRKFAHDDDDVWCCIIIGLHINETTISEWDELIVFKNYKNEIKLKIFYCVEVSGDTDEGMAKMR